MFSNRLAFAALAAACIAAAAGGGYLASRQNAVPAPVAASYTPAGPESTSVPASVTPERPVQETEAVVGDSAKPAASTEPAGAARTDSTPVPRREMPRASSRETKPPAKNSARREQAPAPGTLSSSWPSGSTAQTPAMPSAPVTIDSQTRPVDHTDHVVQEAPRPPEPPQKTYEELVVSADSVIGLQNDTRVTSETARVEDRVEARVTRDVRVGDRVAIAAGARALGNVTIVEKGGRFKERARLGVRFHTLVLADGTRIPISTETIYRDGDPPANGSAAKVGGGAAVGAILGAILGGAKGAAIGGSAGAGAGTAAVVAGDRSAAVLQPNAPITVRILSPITVTQERD
jgi:hypothetical protein